MPQKTNRGRLVFFSETGAEGGRWAFQEECGTSYEELHILQNGDRLRIFDKINPRKVVWEGTVSLKQYPLFTEEVFGFWIHADQEAIGREIWARWFFGEYPAELSLEE